MKLNLPLICDVFFKYQVAHLPSYLGSIVFFFSNLGWKVQSGTLKTIKMFFLVVSVAYYVGCMYYFVGTIQVLHPAPGSLLSPGVPSPCPAPFSSVTASTAVSLGLFTIGLVPKILVAVFSCHLLCVLVHFV